MLETVGGDDLSAAFVNAVLLALWAVLPALTIAYLRQSLRIRRYKPEFMLQKSERGELTRAVSIYGDVCQRLEQIRESDELTNGFWRAALSPADVPEQNDELVDLTAHADLLRAMIFRLRNQPLLRLKSWIKTRSSQFALGYAIAIHLVSFVLLWLLAFGVSDQPAWAQEFQNEANNQAVWYPFDEWVFYANAAAISIATVAVPLVYLVRRYSLRRQYSLEFSLFTDLADIGTAESIYESDFASQQPYSRFENDLGDESWENDWIRILGVSETATIDEVKRAYKSLIKQNHPDRVQGMSQAFKKLAETETKKINAAYQQALNSASPA
jgi:uncharacterized membrane protein YecN with MAPEG domain